MAAARQYCTFYLAGQCYGLEISAVQEILYFQALTRVPLAPPVVRGLLNMRGQIVLAIDLRRRLRMQDRPTDQVPINVVVQTDDGPLSLLVDEIGDIVKVSDSAFEGTPETLAKPARELIRGVYKLKDRLMHALDLNKILTPENGEAAPARLASPTNQPSHDAGLREYSS